MKNFKINKIHFPTALGLLFLLVGIGIAVLLIKTRTAPTNSGADESIKPTQVRITNVSDSSFSVSWITSKAATGLIKYGETEESAKQSALDDRDQLSGETEAVEVHHITAKNLKAQTKYYFKVDSGGKQFDNQGKLFEVTTGATLGNPPAADPVYGTILSASGTPLEGVVVYINIANGAPLSALSRTNGNWALSLATARTSDLSSYLTYDTQATLVNILAQGGKQGTAPAITTTANDSPVSEITLGKSHDFRTIASINELGGEDLEGGFEESLASDSGEFDTASDSGEVSLENPSYDGEILNATQPAFIGSGPPGKVLAIEVNSEETYTGSAIVDEDGDWEFTPPAGLEPGEHTITISYLDVDGEEQTLLRTFVVAASGETDVPAIVATPSGSTASSAARTSMPATDVAIPHPGGGEVSILIVVAGLGLLIGGIKIKKLL